MIRGVAVAVAVVVIVLFGYHAVYSFAADHHIGAPADPYGPCPAGSTYTVFWFKPGQYTQGQGPGVQTYMGWTEVASCSGQLTIGLQTQSHQAGQP